MVSCYKGAIEKQGFDQLLTMYHFSLFLFLILLSAVKSDVSGPRVRTKYGWIQGQTISVRDKLIDEFVGVPFAKPPVGDLRFSKPVELNPWNGIRNATSVSAQCPQPNPYVVYSEDCLYLNIWRATPSKPSSQRAPSSQAAPSLQ